MPNRELAIDSDGEPIEVPPHIVGWRLRRLQPDGRGRPELVHDALGRPVVLTVDATFEELRDLAGPGRYRLDPLDASGRVDSSVKTACTGYVQPVDTAADVAGPTGRAGPQPRMSYEDMLMESMRMNMQLSHLVVEKLPSILTSAGSLIAAADGAGMPQRQALPALPAPPAPEPEDSDDGDDAAEPEITPEPEVEPTLEPAKLGWMEGFMAQLQPYLTQLLPSLIAWLAKSAPAIVASLGDMPPGAFFDWRRAVPTKKPAEQAASPGPAASETAAPAEAATPPPVGPTEYALLLRIYQRLTPDEQLYARHLISQVPEDVRNAFLAELAALPLDEAVARVRHQLRPPMSNPPNGHASAGSGGAPPLVHYWVPPPAVAWQPSAAPTHEPKAPPSTVGAATAPGVAVPTASHAPAAPTQQPLSTQRTTVPSGPTPPTVSSPSATIPSATSAPIARAAVRNSVPRASTPRAAGETSIPSPLALHSFTSPTAAPTTLPESPSAEERLAALQAVFSAIWSALSPDECEQGQRFVESLAVDQQLAWLFHLERLPLPDAVAWMRSLLEAHRGNPPNAAPGTPSTAGPPSNPALAKATNGAP